jgi:hypothetical protein
MMPADADWVVVLVTSPGVVVAAFAVRVNVLVAAGVADASAGVLPFAVLRALRMTALMSSGSLL